MKVTTTWQGDISFESASRNSGHSVRMDASKAAGGSDSAPSPMEMLLHGAAGCMGIDLCVIMRHHMPHVESLELELDGERAETEPKRFTDIEITAKVKGDVPAKVLNRAVKLSHEKYCSAVNSLNAKVTTKAVLNGEEI